MSHEAALGPVALEKSLFHGVGWEAEKGDTLCQENATNFT